MSKLKYWDGGQWKQIAPSKEEFDNQIEILSTLNKIQTASGTANEISVTTNANFQYNQGNRISFRAVANSTGNVTINIDGKGAKALRKLDGTQIGENGIKNGKVYEVFYNTSNDSFFLLARAEGDAIAENVLAGKIFSNDDDTGIKGTMPDRGTVNITPSASNQTILGGRHSGSGVVYGVTVPVANVLAGTTIAGQVGTMPNRTGHVTGQSTSVSGTTLRIRPTAGYYGGATDNSVQFSDANFTENNIRSGINLFGITGSMVEGANITGVQRGTTYFHGSLATNNVTLSSIDMSKSIVMYPEIHVYDTDSSSTNSDRTRFTSQLTSNTNLNLQRIATGGVAVCVNWEVVTFSNIKNVQRGVVNVTGDQYNKQTLSISTVNLSKCFLICTFRTNSSQLRHIPIMELASSTSLRFWLHQGSATVQIEWQLIEFN